MKYILWLAKSLPEKHYAAEINSHCPAKIGLPNVMTYEVKGKNTRIQWFQKYLIQLHMGKLFLTFKKATKMHNKFKSWRSSEKERDFDHLDKGKHAQHHMAHKPNDDENFFCYTCHSWQSAQCMAGVGSTSNLWTPQGPQLDGERIHQRSLLKFHLQQ